MEEFKTHIFVENELLTHNKKVLKERTFYIGILILLIALILYQLDSPYTAHFIGTAMVVLFIGRALLSGQTPSVGYVPATLVITKDSVTFGSQTIPLDNKGDIHITIGGYKGQWKMFPIGFFQTSSGNDNIIRIHYGDKNAQLKFILYSQNHKAQLIEFCEEHGFEFGK